MPGEITLRKYLKGATVVKEGDAATALYIVVRGQVEIVRPGTKPGRELGPGSMFGEMASLEGARYHATARAVTETVCVVVPQEKLADLEDTLT